MTVLLVSTASQPLRGSLTVPSDKSISHRAAILAALADGETRIENFLDSGTTNATLECLSALGAEIERANVNTLIVRGRGLHSLCEPDRVLYCAGSGTTMRLLAGLCAGQPFFTVLDGTPALKRRPMGRVAEPLRQMGATILGREGGNLPPISIQGGQLHGIGYALPVASAQVKSALLLAGLFADAPTIVREPGPSRDHTERMLRACGAKIDTEPGGVIRLEPASDLRVPSTVSIPGDLSSAAFLVILASLIPDSEIRIQGVGLNPTRTGILDVLAQMGADIVAENRHEESGEPVADLIVKSASALHGTAISGEIVPRMIDEFPILAVAATLARGETVVRDAQELRVKESDRIGTLAAELRKMGARIQERPDGFVISGPTGLNGAKVSAHNDHRLAMSLAVAALVAQGETEIEGWECTQDSFPHFERVLARTRV